MTMHGMFWRFPRNFQPTSSAGIAPRSTYLKVVGDFCRWQDRIVLGCDDTAKSEFLNKRKAKGEIAAPQSQSNLWFLQPEQLDKLGPVLGRGAVWLDDDVQPQGTSEPMLFSGFTQRALHLAHASDHAITLELELDQQGNNQWQPWKTVEMAAKGTQWLDLSDAPKATWIRLRSKQAAQKLTAWFTFSSDDGRAAQPTTILAGLAPITNANSTSPKVLTGGTLRARGGNKRTLHFLAEQIDAASPKQLGLYELDGTLTLKPDNDTAALEYHRQNAAIAVGTLSADAASIIYTDDAGKRWRLPRATDDYSLEELPSAARVCREVATERDLFNAGGTFYELPAENAGGFSKVRAVATHARHIVDYCSYRGLLVMSGIADDPSIHNPHLIRSSDQKTALWVGAVDDVWQFGKPRGVGGPWKDTPAKASEPSEPYLLTGFDRKCMELSHDAQGAVTFTIECDITGTGHWLPFREVEVPAGKSVALEFPKAYAAYWLRATAETDCRATCQLKYD